MARFEIHIVVDDAVSSVPSAVWTAADGDRVTCARVGDACQFVVDHCFDPTRRGLLIPTMAQRALAEAPEVYALPDGWEASRDGSDVVITDSVSVRTKKYVRAVDGLVVEAPCGAAEEPTAETVRVLGAVAPADTARATA